ncbi:o-succinylbenzoate--CoA ligase [Nocardioides ginkgobilobae]
MDLTGSTAEAVRALTGWLERDDDEPLVIATSGSTGRPKRVVLGREAVLASVRASRSRVGAEGAWLLTLPATYVAGAQVVARSWLAGHAPVLAEEHGSFAEATAALMRAHPTADRFTSLVPTQLHRMLGGGDGGGDGDGGRPAHSTPDDVWALRTFHTVLLGGGPVDPALRARAEAAGVRVVATYGAAETAGGCVYDGHPLDGVAVALGPSGRIRLAGPTLFSGYDGDPALTAEVLVDGWFHTADAGRLDDDGRLHVLGRVDDVVVTGGVNVPGPAVAARLREHPDLLAAEVLGVPDEEWGRRLVAFVVARSPGRVPSTQELRDWVAEQRPRSWAPRQVLAVPEIPLLANGKPDRVALVALAGEPS